MKKRSTSGQDLERPAHRARAGGFPGRNERRDWRRRRSREPPARLGSLEGVGDDVELDPTMGSISHGVATDLPAGLVGARPSLSRSYASYGSGAVGLARSMNVLAIGRMTSRAAPVCTIGDRFNLGAEELTQAGANGGDLIFRARLERVTHVGQSFRSMKTSGLEVRPKEGDEGDQQWPSSLESETLALFSRTILL